MLPQIGSDAYPGDTVTCGLCLHIWTPMPVQLKPDTANAGTESATFAPCSENCEPARPLGVESAHDQREAGAAAEHYMVCSVCGGDIDLRCLDQVAFHENHTTAPDIQYSGSVRMCGCF